MCQVLTEYRKCVARKIRESRKTFARDLTVYRPRARNRLIREVVISSQVEIALGYTLKRHEDFRSLLG